MRTVVKDALYKGNPCPALTQSRACNMPACPPPALDCHLAAWAGWSNCTRGCGGGTQTRHRAIEVAPAYGGEACAATFQNRSCNPQTCPVDCVVSDFNDWSECTRSCGTGERVRTRTVEVASVLGGAACPALTVRAACNTFACAVDCDMAPWGAWTECTLTCGTGQQSRTRSVNVPAQNGGEACSTKMSDTRDCNDRPCPVACLLGAFDAWTSCSASCGGGRQMRERPIVTPPMHYGAPCPHRTEARWCNTSPCPQDCKLSYWGSFTECYAPTGCGARP